MRASLPQYIELRCRSAFSFLTGASLPEDLVDRAAALDYPALALGDRVQPLDLAQLHRARLQGIVEVTERACYAIRQHHRLGLEQRRQALAHIFQLLGWHSAFAAFKDALTNEIGEIEPGVLVPLFYAVNHTQALPGAPEAPDVAKPGTAATVETRCDISSAISKVYSPKTNSADGEPKRSGGAPAYPSRVRFQYSLSCSSS